MENEARALRYYKLKDFHIEISPEELRKRREMEDYRGTAILGVWLGMAGIIGIFNYTEYLAGVSLWLVFAAIMLTAHIVRNPLKPYKNVAIEYSIHWMRQII